MDGDNSIDEYLAQVRDKIIKGQYQIESNPNRVANRQLSYNYLITVEDKEKIILELNSNHFVNKTRNKKPGYQKEILYIFSREVKLLSRFTGQIKKVTLYIKFNMTSEYLYVVSFHESE